MHYHFHFLLYNLNVVIGLWAIAMPWYVVLPALPHHPSRVINNNCCVPQDIPVIFVLRKSFSSCIAGFVPRLTFLKIKLRIFGRKGIGIDTKIS